MSVTNYKCPCCGAPLSYSGQSGKMECASCGNAYDMEAIEALSQTESGGGIEFEMPKAEFSDADAAQMQVFTCQNCGAELMTDGTTTATQCAYCGSPAILPSQIEGGVKPEFVVPFKISQEAAVKAFEDYFHGKRLLPNIFLNSRNRISEMRKLYVPYWLFDCDADADMVFDAEKRRTSREGDYEVTRTDHYMVRRAGSLGFDGIPVDASAKLDDKIGESLEPYDTRERVAFQPAVLAGAMADHADVDADECRLRAVERVEQSIEDAMRDSVQGFSSVSLRHKQVESRGGKVTPALMPVWLITTDKQIDGQKKTYTFAINGQSGELTCDVPYAKGKAAAWFFGIFAGVFAVGYGVLVALSAMGVIG